MPVGDNTDLPVHLRGYVEAMGAGIPARPDDLLLRPPKRRGRQDRQQYAWTLLRGLHAGHLRPRHHRRTAQGGANHGEHPLPCGIDLSATRSRWGQSLGQKKETSENSNYRKTINIPRPSRGYFLDGRSPMLPATPHAALVRLAICIGCPTHTGISPAPFHPYIAVIPNTYAFSSA